MHLLLLLLNWLELARSRVERPRVRYHVRLEIENVVAWRVGGRRGRVYVHLCHLLLLVVFSMKLIITIILIMRSVQYSPFY